MFAPYPQLTPEQQEAIAASGGLPIRVEDPATHKIYVLAEVSGDGTLPEDYVQSELARGLAAIEAGDRVAWEPQKIKEEGRRRLASRKASE